MLNFVLSSASWWDNYKELHFTQYGAPPHLLLLVLRLRVKNQQNGLREVPNLPPVINFFL